MKHVYTFIIFVMYSLLIIGSSNPVLELKSVPGAAHVSSESQPYSSFNSWKKAIDALPYLVAPHMNKHGLNHDTMHKGNTPSDLDFAEFERVETQFFTSMESASIRNPENWVNARIVNWKRQTIPALTAAPMAPSPDFFNADKDIERQSFVQKLVVPIGTKLVLHGDLHGDVHSLTESLAPYLDGNDGFKLKEDVYVIFLGDYVDRGLYGFECIYTLMRLKIDNPERVFMTRGNHEDSAISDRYGFGTELEKKGILPHEVAKIYRLYDLLPTALYVGSGNHFIQLCHGGLEIGFNPDILINATGTERFQWLNSLDRKATVDRLKGDVYTYLSSSQGIADNIIPMPGSTTVGWVQGMQTDICIGHCWCDFNVSPHARFSGFNARGWTLSCDATQQLLALSNHGTHQLCGIMRAHQHAPSWDDMMTLILDRSNQDPENKGVAKLWTNATKKGSKLWNGIVVTLNVSPDMLYAIPNGSWTGFDFDTICEIVTHHNFNEWTLTVHRKKITKLPSS